MDNVKREQDVALGAKAHIALEYMEKIMKAREQKALNELRQMYRDGQFDEKKYFGQVGVLVTLQDIEQSIKQDIRKSETAAKERPNA